MSAKGHGFVTEGVVELTVEEGRALFERNCQAELGVSAAEFLDRYPDDIPLDWSPGAVTRLEILLPFNRYPLPPETSTPMSPKTDGYLRPLDWPGRA